MNFFVLFLSVLVVSTKDVLGIFDGLLEGTSFRWPFVAAIWVESNAGKYFCGGALWGNEWILTAGQCVYGANSFSIQLGSYRLDGEKEELNPWRTIVNSSEYILHPEYNPNTLENDLGLIKIQPLTEFLPTIRPIDWLPTSQTDNETIVSAFGWGQTGNNGLLPVNILRWNTMIAMHNEECRSIYGNQLKDTMMCVKGIDMETRICSGDTGGPLLENYGDISVIVGVASFLSGNGCESSDPSGFTRTFPYNDWIKNITNHI